TLRLEVTDTGKGIPDGELPHLFRRFYQGPGEGRTGTGIGLALVRELTELLGGTVSVRSRPGAGSAFTVTLPVAEGASRAERPDPAPAPPLPRPEEAPGPATGSAAAPWGKPILLVAEDDAELRDYLGTVFSPHYHVLTAADGETALQLAGVHLPDAVVTDWMMPGLEGPELCRRLKHDEKTCHIPVVLLTSRSGPPSQLVGLAAGADDYVAKPFHATLLLQRVHNLVQNRLRLRRAFGRPGWLPAGEAPASRLDESFLQKAAALVEEHLDDPHFDAEQLQEALNLSQMQLYRKLKSLTDLSGRDFIRYVRLQRAAQLLEAGGLGVSEVAYRVGFNDPAYFSRSFKKQFGRSPLEHARSS
ncbi:MAG TPA: response regulator, partial [Cytophagales bacterium]